MTEPTAPPGWYDQPDRSRRYWDGTAWTEHVQLPTAAPQRKVYEGIRWLGVRWGRNGRPVIHRVLAGIFVLLAIVQALNAAQGSSLAWGYTTVSVGAVIAAVANAIEAHFAARVQREQA